MRQGHEELRARRFAPRVTSLCHSVCIVMLLLAAQVFRRGQRLRNEMSPWAVEVHGGVDVAQVMPELLVALFVRRGFAPVFLCVVRCVSVLLPGGSLRSPGLRPRIVGSALCFRGLAALARASPVHRLVCRGGSLCLLHSLGGGHIFMDGCLFRWTPPVLLFASGRIRFVFVTVLRWGFPAGGSLRQWWRQGSEVADRQRNVSEAQRDGARGWMRLHS